MDPTILLIGILLLTAVMSIVALIVLRQKYVQPNAITADADLIGSLPFGLLVVDTSGTIKRINPMAKRLLGIKNKAIGQEQFGLLNLHTQGKSVERDAHPVCRCLKTKKEVHVNPEVHFSIVRTDGSALAVRITVSPLLDGGQLDGAVVVIQDYTSERQVDYMKTEFIALASHQLRTPLSSVQWYSELLATEQQDLLSDMQKSFVVELRLAVHRMTTIVNELMDVSRLQSGGLTPVLKDTDITEMVNAMSQNMKLLADEKGVTISAHVPSEPITLSTDSMQLGIVLQNIVSNAIKYSHQGGSVQMSLEEDQGHVKINVRDNGIGIPPDDQPHIFEKLYRAHNVHKVDVNGSGLGLYCSQKIADQLGGSIVFKSEEGKGSTFTVQFAQSNAS